jgi:hypothetical protein
MKDWYFTINEYCLHLSCAFNVPVIKVAAIMSCLSPQNKFNQNCIDLENFLMSNGITGAATYGNQVIKARIILRLETYNEEIIQEIIGKGLKTKAFFENIYRPHNSEKVTVDLWQVRWAKRLNIIPQKGSLTPKRYKIVSDAVKSEANKRGIMPHQFQALSWINERGSEF